MHKSIEEKIDRMNQEIGSRVDLITQTLNQQGKDMEQMGNEMDQVNNTLEKVLKVDDGKRIWKNFQRFAEYNDLKELYKKCVPQIADFEFKIIGLADQLE